MPSPERATRLPGGKLFCKTCRISVYERDWQDHESSQVHIAKGGPDEPDGEAPIPSVPITQGRQESMTTSAEKHTLNQTTGSRSILASEEYLPESFFDESSELIDGNVQTSVADDEPLPADRTAEMESNIRTALQKRPREDDGDSADEEDLDWRRKKL